MRKRTIFMALVLLIALLCQAVVPAYAATTYSPPFEVEAQAAYLYNLSTETLIYEKNADMRLAPASLVKLMTAILTFEMVDDLDGTEITAPAYIYDELYLSGASTADIRRGETMSVRKLLYALLMQSAAEAASILADYLGDSSIPYFVEMMNEKAAEIGCTNTHFVNPHGLHDDDQYTTAYDMYLIARYAMQVPGLMEICETTRYQLGPTNIHDENYWMLTTNQMMVQGSQYYYEPVRGIKTGTLWEVGGNFVSTASQGGYEYLLVLLGAPAFDDEGNSLPVKQVFVETKEIYEWAFSSFREKTLMDKGKELTELPLELCWGKDFIKVMSGDRFTVLLPDEVEASSVILEYELPDTLRAPIQKGDEVGQAKLMLAGEEVGRIRVLAAETVERSTALYVLDVIKTVTSSFWFKFLVLFFGLLLIAYISLAVIRNRNRRRYGSVRRRKNL